MPSFIEIQLELSELTCAQTDVRATNEAVENSHTYQSRHSKHQRGVTDRELK